MIARLTLAGTPLPLVGRARAYVCGITPYDTTHLGHAATFVWADVAGRVLRRAGVEVTSCRNVTDVDDVLDAAASRAGSRYDTFAAVGQFRFEHDMAALGVRTPTHEPRAHNHVDAVVALAAGLLRRGVAYERDGAVLLRAADSGLADLPVPDADASLEPVHPRAEDPRDALVWRPAAPGEAAWPSPWGDGRPGWHAECAAMALSVLGPSIDLHVGGADLAHPHHSHQAAMAEALTGVRPFARARLHVGAVRVGGVKMAKSSGNLLLVSDLLERHSAAAVRLLVLDRSWAADQDVPEDGVDALLTAAADRLERLYGAASRPGTGAVASAAVVERLLDDLDVPGALALAQDEGGDAARTALAVLGLA